MLTWSLLTMSSQINIIIIITYQLKSSIATHGQINPRSHNSSTSADPPNNNTQWGNVSHSVPACQYCGRCDHTAKTCYKLHGIGTPLIIISTKQICHNMITVLIPIGCLICDLGNLSISLFNTLAPPLYLHLSLLSNSSMPYM